MLVLTMLAVVLVSVIATINADYSVTLESSPDIIVPVLTKSLQLRCAVLSDSWYNTQQPSTTTSLYDMITNQQPDNSTDSRPQDNPQETSSGPSIAKLLSLVITKLNQETGQSETLASVTGCSSPLIEEKFRGTFEVEGSSEGSNRYGEIGYLLLTWDRPGIDVAGNYTCEVYALNLEKHSVSLNATIGIVATVPSIADLVAYIASNEREITSLQLNINSVAADYTALIQETYQLSLRVADLENKLAGLNEPNIQTGSLSCYNQEVYFPQSFNSTPIVFLSTMSASISTSSYSYISASYYTNIQSVTNNSFYFTCSQSYFSPTLSWLAIDNRNI